MARSPEYLMPPSAMTGMPDRSAAATASMIAVSCGTPTPATMRVVQIEPGPMPTLTASAPASISACAPSAVATLPAITCTRLESFFTFAHRFEHALGVAVRGIDDDEVDLGIDQPLGAGEAGIADAGRGGDAQPALVVLGGVRVEAALFDVLDGDQPDAAVVVVDDEQLLDAVLVEEPLGFLRVDGLADRDQVFASHQLGDRLRRIGGEANVAVGEDADGAGRGRRRSRPPGCRKCCGGASARGRRRASLPGGW